MISFSWVKHCSSMCCFRSLFVHSVPLFQLSNPRSASETLPPLWSVLEMGSSGTLVIHALVLQDRCSISDVFTSQLLISLVDPGRRKPRPSHRNFVEGTWTSHLILFAFHNEWYWCGLLLLMHSGSVISSSLVSRLWLVPKVNFLRFCFFYRYPVASARALSVGDSHSPVILAS